MSSRRSTPATPPATSSPYVDSASEASDYGQPQPKTVPQSTAKKSPSVFKSQSQRGSGSAQPSEPLVKASRKQKPDPTRGAYAPVPLPGSSQVPRSSSEFSDDPEMQFPSRQQQQSGMQGESESEVDQEEEKESRPAQTKGEKRKRLLWTLIAGGAVVVVIIIIIVLILVLHSPESDAEKAATHTLNSTSETEHETNSTSSLSHNSTSSAPMVSQGANSTSSVIDDLILGSTSATSTNATSLPTVTSGVEEMETLSDAHGPSTSLSESLPAATPTQSGLYDMEHSTEIGSLGAEPTPSATSVVDASTHESSASLDSASFEPLDTLSNPAVPTLSLNLPSSTAQSATEFEPSSTDVSQIDNAQHDDQEVPSQPSEADHKDEQDMGSNASELPNGWLSVAPVSSISYGNIVHPSKAIEETPSPASRTASAWWPLVTDNADRPEGAIEPTREGNTTKWNGKATWFDPSEASNSCQSTFGDADFVVALSSDLYGQEDAVSPLCGSKVLVWNGYTNQTRDATVIGVCSDCEDPTDINLIKSLFAELDNPDIGILEVQWWFENTTIAESIEVDLSKYVTTAIQQEPTTYDTTAIFWKQTGWKSTCGQKVEDDSMFIGLPLSVWPEPSKTSEYCKKKVTVQNAESNLSIEAEVAEASNRTEYTTFTKKAFEALGGDVQQGELKVKFWFSE